MQEKVSVVITTYGGKQCIENAVRSCLAQTYKNIEIIVVDDNGLGSDAQKATEEILKPYIETHKIIYIPHTINLNASAARNTGVSNSTGSFISLLDDDDTYESKKIEYQIEAFENLTPDYGIVYCSMRDYVDGKIYEYQASTQGNALYKFLMMKVSACTSNIMIRKSLYEQIGGFDVTFKRHQDWEFLARALAVSKIFGISYIGTTKHTKNIIKRFTASQAESFRLYYIELLKSVVLNLPTNQQNNVVAHEYNEIAKLFMREKNIRKVLNYMRLSGKPVMLIKDFIKKPFVAYNEKKTMKKIGKVVLFR